jgi:dienelactone hydrolase
VSTGRKSKRTLTRCLLAALAITAGTSRAADDVERLSFPSVGSIVRAPDTRYELRKESVPLSGNLRLPEGAGPFPAVILAHGCAGFGYGDLTWLPLLREWGYATLTVDSFASRGVTSVCTTGSLIPLQSVPDVYGALRRLATHPEIDATRIVLMGFSHGGIVTLNAATTWAANLHAPTGQPRFRGFVAFYPYCNNRYPERDEIAAPLRIHTGALDDWTPPQPCADWVDELKARGQDAAIHVYPGAHHSFDTPTGDVVYFAQAANFARCSPNVAHITGPYTFGQHFAHCWKRGAHAGRNGAATAGAKTVLQRELAEMLTVR